MRILVYFSLAIVISNCSLNQDSKYWTEDSIKKQADNQKLIKIIEKSNDMNPNEKMRIFVFYLYQYHVLIDINNHYNGYC